MDERDNSDLGLDPVSSSFLVDHILRRSESKSLESGMEAAVQDTVKAEGGDMQNAIDYDTLTGSGTSDEFAGLSCMVAEAEIKGARQFPKGIPSLLPIYYRAII